jgi:hypothetical protein
MEGNLRFRAPRPLVGNEPVSGPTDAVTTGSCIEALEDDQVDFVGHEVWPNSAGLAIDLSGAAKPRRRPQVRVASRARWQQYAWVSAVREFSTLEADLQGTNPKTALSRSIRDGRSTRGVALHGAHLIPVQINRTRGHCFALEGTGRFSTQLCFQF